MKMTCYELLGLVKDGKAPKVIKHKNIIYTLNNEFNDYYGDNIWFIADYVGCDAFTRLNDEVEILEEEKKIPERLEDGARFQYSQIPSWFRGKELIDTINENFEKHQKAIYELIDYFKSKGE